MMTRLIVLAVAACFAWAPAAQGSIIALSNADSVAGGGAGLDASIEFLVSGSTLTVSFTNNSSVNVTDIFFNSAVATTLSLTSFTSDGNGITNFTLGTGAAAPSFGTFDFALLKGGGGPNTRINPGETATFTLSITSGSPVDTDFTSQANASLAIVAANFNGTTGATVALPEPAALGMLGLGLGALAFVRRRRTN